MIIKVRVIPTTGNNEVISRIGSVLRVNIIIVKGAKGKEKTVEVRDKSEEELRKIMDSIP